MPRAFFCFRLSSCRIKLGSFLIIGSDKSLKLLVLFSIEAVKLAKDALKVLDVSRIGYTIN